MTLDESIVHLQHSLFCYASRWTRNADRARDLVNDTIVKALSNRDKFDGTNAIGWLMTIMRNHFIAEARRLRNRNEVYVDNLRDERMRDAPQPTELELKDTLAAIERLSPAYRRILLVAANGGSYDEIGETCGMKLGTVKSQLWRARQALNKALEEVREDGN